ncbi:MAG TPA: hypothetical protein VIR55_07745 [Ignavibacteria bacterium]
MNIKRTGFGNSKEAFIENNIKNGVNIIFSDDNNKGKTLVIQGMMYALGNEPIFPSGFPFEQYYFYTEIEIGGKKLEFLRHNNSIAINDVSNLYLFDSITEMKYFLKNEDILDLPLIVKDTRETVCDLSLFYEMFFIGQDKRNPSNVINYGYNKKQDFINMLCSMNGYPLIDIQENIKEIEEKITNVKAEISTTKKLLKLLKVNPQLSSYIDKFSDDLSVTKLRDRMKKIHGDIGEYKKKRTAEINRKTRLEVLIDELNSLNRNIEKGKIICADCGSDRIVYTNRDLSFDVSNTYVRQKVLRSINFQIAQKEEIIDEYSRTIHKEQDKLKTLLKDIPDDIQKILLYSEEILSGIEYDNKLSVLNEELRSLLQANNSINENSKEARKKYIQMKNSIVEKMNQFYSKVDPNGTLNFDDLFTKKNVTYSGSEEQEYYYCRLLALNEHFQHEFPIIIDCFRSGEISTSKEEFMIQKFQEIGKQVILTSTLKKEEYDSHKYDKYEDVNVIDYSMHEDSNILQKSYSPSMQEILNVFGVSEI